MPLYSARAVVADRIALADTREALQGAKSRSYEALDASLAKAWGTVTDLDAQGWYTIVANSYHREKTDVMLG